MLIIGLHGRARTGKGRITEHLVVAHNFDAYAFADPIWAMVGAAFDVDMERLDYDGPYKEAQLPGMRHSPRELAQHFGDAGRQLDRFLWINNLAARIERAILLHDCDEGEQRILITDIRTNDEAEYVQSLGGHIWHVTRPDAPLVRAHFTERTLDTKYINNGVVNDGTLEQLYARVDALLRQHPMYGQVIGE